MSAAHDRRTQRQYLRTFTSPTRGLERAVLHQQSRDDGGQLLLLVKDGQPARIGEHPHRCKTHRSYVVTERFEVDGVTYVVTEDGGRYKMPRR